MAQAPKVKFLKERDANGFVAYQDLVRDTAIYPGQGTPVGLMYAALGLNGEAGEVAEQVKKAHRNDGVLTDRRRDNLIGEIGDVLWYAAQLCNEANINLGQIAQANIDKLQERKLRDALCHE